jgi:hypothetical protein
VGKEGNRDWRAGGQGVQSRAVPTVIFSKHVAEKFLRSTRTICIKASRPGPLRSNSAKLCGSKSSTAPGGGPNFNEPLGRSADDSKLTAKSLVWAAYSLRRSGCNSGEQMVTEASSSRVRS